MKYKLFLLSLLMLIGAFDSMSQTINPTQTDEIIIDNGASGKADPNDRIRYKVTIQNTGANGATGTQLNIVPDPRTMFVPGSFRSSPLAVNDAYTCTGNIGISVPAASGVKSNDFDDNLPIATLSVTTPPVNGSVSLNNDGSFTYTPNAGFNGTDNFTYTLTDGDPVGLPVPLTDMATVTITVSNLVWFVDNTGGGSGGTGTLGNPFKTLGDFNSSAGPQAGHVVFIKNTGTKYNGGIVLKNNMYLFGTGHSGGTTLADVLPFSVAPNSISLPAINGTKPIIVSPTHGITLASGNTIRGVEVGYCSGGSAAKIFGSNFGTLSIGNTANPDVALSGNRQVMNLTNGSFAAGSKIASINSPDTSTLVLNTVSGALACGSTTVNANQSAATKTIDIQNSSAALDFGVTNVSHFGSGTVISITNSGTGYVTFSSLTMPSAQNGVGLFANAGGTINIGGTGNTITARTSLDLTNTSLGSGATFASITSNNSSGKGVNLDNVSGSLVINGGSITNSSGIAFDINAGSSTVTYAGAINNANRAVEVTGRTGGTITFSGNITNTGTGINVASNTGGTVVFSGTSKSLSTGANTAVTLSSNSGSTINFTNGGLVISTAAGTGFSATGGGTVTVQGAGNTINSTSATALNVTSTTIGASGITFQSISSGNNTAATDPAKGISLNATGSGPFTVTGVGATGGSGGTIQNITTRGAEFISAQSITLKNMNFTSACTSDFPAAPTGLSLGNNTADNAAIHLQSSNDVTLDNLNISNSEEQGINGHNINGFTLTNSVLSGLGNSADEDGLHFYNMVGTCSISNTSITSSGDDNVNIQNNTTPIAPPISFGTITISGGSFNTGVLGSGILFGIRGTSNTTIDIAGVTINNNFSGGVVADCYDNATMDVEVSTSTIINNNDAIAISSNNGNTKFDIHNNSNISGQDFGNIAILKAAFSTGGILEGRIRNNTITTENGHVADNISVFNAGGGTLAIAITNNTIDYAGTQRAINLQGGQDGASTLEATITGNNIDVKLDGMGNAVNAILANSQVADPSGAGSSLCADIGGAGGLANNITHSLGGTLAGGDIRVRQRFSANVKLPGYGGGATDTAAVAAYLDGRNNETSASTASFASGIFTGGSACLQPSN